MSTDKLHQNKIAIINDISGYGRCSITVALPVISACGIQCCPLPTSIFSSHTGYPEYFFDDFTAEMEPYIDSWKALKIHFDGILTGFLGSEDQIEIVDSFLKDFAEKNTRVIIDPVMGDGGKRYATYTDSMCLRMRELVKHAYILTPNLTEACILTDTPYEPDRFTGADYHRMAEKLINLGAEKVVITGIPSGSMISNFVCEKEKVPHMIRRKRTGKSRPGTGDLFSSIIAADCLNSMDFTSSVARASDFVRDSIKITEKYDIDSQNGVCFEKLLKRL